MIARSHQDHLIPSRLGAPIQRAEDPALITGTATFTEDLTPAGTLYLALLRSPFPHARINAIDTAQAASAPGVWAIYTGADVADLNVPPAPNPKRNVPRRFALAQDRVLMPGDPVAAVVAESPAHAFDAMELIEVDYEPLDLVGDLDEALTAPPLHAGQESNVAYDRAKGDWEAISALDGVVVEGVIEHPRIAPTPIEGRLALAQWADGVLTLRINTQAPHLIAEELARCLDLPNSSVRVITGFVGGAFGAKFDLAEEEMLTVFASRQLGRPVKWVEGRREHFLAVGHGRAMRAKYRLVADRDGRVKAYSVDWLVDLGCRHRYLSFSTITPRMGTGTYDIGLYAWRLRGVWTNRNPRGIYRGAGRPEATLTIERAMDHLASELDMDPAEIRRRNFIRSDQFPYKSVAGYTYDSGNYHGNLESLLKAASYSDLRKAQATARTEGRLIGIGIASYVEVCGFEDWGAARVVVAPDGSVTVLVETLDQGQGHRTVFAQIVSARLGIPMSLVRVEQGDTATAPYGWGTSGSRSLPQTGSATQAAANGVAEKAKRIAAHRLEASPADIDLANGVATVKGTDVTMSWKEISSAAYTGEVPPGDEPGLEEEVRLRSAGENFPFGAHLAVVEVDLETGSVRLERLVAVDDAGVIVNPMLANGQRHGGLAQGIGQALWEAVRYDESGNLTTATFVDYLLPSAVGLPFFELAETETPTTTNPLGAKGIGEAGAIGSTPAVLNAVCDALGRQDLQIPLTPEQIWRVTRSNRE
ncbi:MAG: xanthine dehydrogenase family protein molybdopterin-binding subunit [Acidimicrobiia bacterium]